MSEQATKYPTRAPKPEDREMFLAPREVQGISPDVALSEWEKRKC